MSGKRINEEEFLIILKERFGDILDCSKVKYINKNTSIVLICPIHGEFVKVPKNLLKSKIACVKCSLKSIRLENFIKNSKERFGDFLDYSCVDYVDYFTSVILICPIHGKFKQPPHSHLNLKRKSPCRKCSVGSLTKDIFILKAVEIHGDQYDYSKVNYVDSNTKVEIICPIHGSMFQSPFSHIYYKNGCNECRPINKRLTKEEFVNRSNIIHNNKYDYSLSEYVLGKLYIIIICNKHGKFKQTPDNHLAGHGCSICAKRISKAEIDWLNSLGIPNDKAHRDVLIKINKKRIFADGFDPENKIIYEFNGDYWHGNPDVFDQNKINIDTKKTFGELYRKTMARQKLLEDNGYKVISIWEKDWNKVNKCQK
jgi:hypothetical protein